MSLRSRTLRARLLRLSRRAMRLTIRPAGGEMRTTGLAHLRFSQLIWRRARALRLPRDRATALHLHESHFLIHPEVRVSVQMYLAAARAARWAAAVLPQLAWKRSPEMSQLNGAWGRRHGAQLLAQPLSSRSRSVQPRMEASPSGASVARRLVARALMSWPAGAVERASAPQRAGQLLRQAALLLPVSRRNSSRSGAAEHRPLLERRLQRESSLIARLVPLRLDSESRGAPMPGLRAPTIAPAVRLSRREMASVSAASGNLLASREVVPVPLHYATPKATTTRVAHMEPAVATTATTPAARAMQPAAQAARGISAPMLDRAATDRLADEVIRRIERRVRVERERRGI